MDFTEPIWIGSPIDVRTGTEAAAALATINDNQFMTPAGIVRVTTDRWRLAQKFEETYWMTHALGATCDRSEEHASCFNHYRCLPENLGTMLEAGCGPFTQVAMILGSGHTADFVMLVDPLASEYLKHPNCAYKNKMMGGKQIGLLSCPIEDFQQSRYFDTAVCVNVLEHVVDADVAMWNITSSLRLGGLLVFHERSWDNTSPNLLYDVGHPIRLRAETINIMLSKFKPIFQNDIPFGGGISHYFVGERL